MGLYNRKMLEYEMGIKYENKHTFQHKSGKAIAFLTEAAIRTNQ